MITVICALEWGRERKGKGTERKGNKRENARKSERVTVLTDRRRYKKGGGGKERKRREGKI